MKTTETTSVSHDWGGYFAHAVQEEVNPIFSFQEFLAHLHAWNAPEELKIQCKQIIEAEQTGDRPAAHHAHSPFRVRQCTAQRPGRPGEHLGQRAGKIAKDQREDWDRQ